MALQCVAQPVHPASLDTAPCVQHFFRNDISGQCCPRAHTARTRTLHSEIECGVWIECSDTRACLTPSRVRQQWGAAACRSWMPGRVRITEDDEEAPLFASTVSISNTMPACTSAECTLAAACTHWPEHPVSPGTALSPQLPRSTSRYTRVARQAAHAEPGAGNDEGQAAAASAFSNSSSTLSASRRETREHREREQKEGRDSREGRGGREGRLDLARQPSAIQRAAGSRGSMTQVPQAAVQVVPLEPGPSSREVSAVHTQAQAQAAVVRADVEMGWSDVASVPTKLMLAGNGVSSSAPPVSEAGDGDDDCCEDDSATEQLARIFWKVRGEAGQAA